jgi:hypothetical protein
MKAGKPVRRPGVLATNVGNEVLLCGADQETIHVLNPVAKLIWELCDGTNTPQDMERAIRAGFSDTEARDVLADVRETLETLAAKELIESDGPPR